MSRTVQRQGGASSWKTGILKRPLPPVSMIQFGNFTNDTPGLLTTGAINKVRLHGINANLALSIVAAIVFDGDNSPPTYPPLPGTLKVTPWTHTANGDYLFMKDLTLAPQVLPAAYTMGVGLLLGATADNPQYGTALADGADISLEIDPTTYDGTEIEGQVLLQVTATYNGNWWDVDAITDLFGALRMDEPQKYRIRTSGEGG